MSADIDCPAGGSRKAVIDGKMCVQGVAIDEVGAGLSVRVRIQLRGTVPDPTSNTVDANVVGERWCAQNVPVPIGSGDTELTAHVWLLPVEGDPDDSQDFVGVPGGGSGLDDCCAGCGSGSGSMMAPQFAQAAATLSAGKGVRVTVPDGPDAGHHAAGPTAQLTWQARVGKAVCEVKLCPTDGLVVRVDGKPVVATDVHYEPVSAVLPGQSFGAEGPVLVTQA